MPNIRNSRDVFALRNKQLIGPILKKKLLIKKVSRVDCLPVHVFVFTNGLMLGSFIGEIQLPCGGDNNARHNYSQWFTSN